MHNNHADIYQSVEGFSGRVDEVGTFHPFITFDNTESFGISGQAIDSIVTSSERVHLLKTEEIDKYLL